jgi:quinol-cytochrome oxidoreductase complex cytochrome b subunit
MKKLLANVYASVFRVGWPRDERSALKAMVSSIVLHVHAPKVRPATLRFRATWAMGLVSMVLLLMLTGTGVYLMAYYIPHPDVAFRSMKDLAFVVPFGKVTRNLHRWAAHAMVATVTVHMLRVFLTGGYKPPREANWVAGVILWVLTLALSFTGYLLPWDQLAFWAVTVGTNMIGSVPIGGDFLRELVLGDASVGEAALLRFYVLHCVFLPLAIGGLAAFHIFRVRRDGGLVTSEHAPAAAASAPAADAPAPTKREGRLVPAWPHLVYRELVVTLVVTAALAALSLWLDAPLEPEADRTRTPNPAKAPWYFLGVQELAHYSAFWGGVFIPGAMVVGLCLLPYLDRAPIALGRTFPRERLQACLLFSAMLLFMGVFTVVGTYFRGPGWAFMYWPY